MTSRLRCFFGLGCRGFTATCLEGRHVMTKRAYFKGSVLVCAIALFGFIQPVVFAQLTTAGIVGTVSDPSGSRIPGVTVTALQVETSSSTTANTDSSGNYTFTNLQIGKYSITFQKEGFQ